MQADSENMSLMHHTAVMGLHQLLLVTTVVHASDLRLGLYLGRQTTPSDEQLLITLV